MMLLRVVFLLLVSASVFANDSTLNNEIKSIIEKHRPLNGGIVPSNIKEKLGVTHVDGRYFFTNEPFMIEGAKKTDSLGFGVLKLWFSKTPQRSYPFNSMWKTNPNITLKELARHNYYKAVFSMPFSTIILCNSGVSKTSPWKLSVEELKNEETEMYNLACYLLKTYRKRRINFIIQNWEGDWLMRGGTGSQAQWGKVEVPNDVNERTEGMKRWFSARQSGIERARKETRNSHVKVYHAIEVNKVTDGMKGIPSITTHVLPFVTTDMVSWSAYDGLLDDGVTLYKGLKFIKSKMQSSGYAEDKDVYIGEIGIPEEVANNGDGNIITQRWDIFMGVALALDIPYIIHWELYCNEPKNSEAMIYPVKDNKEMRGFWIIKPDGTTGFAYNYLQKLLKNSGGYLLR